MHWGKLITITGSAQVIVQAMGFLSGILVIRLLSVEDYALYTLANTMLGAMMLIGDGGIATGVMSRCGQIWTDISKMGSILNTGFILRKYFAVISLLILLPLLTYLLLYHGASWSLSIMISLSILPAYFSGLSNSLLEIPLKLRQDIKNLQINQIEVSIGRLLLTGITLFIYPWVYLALLASGIPRIYGNLKLRIIAKQYSDFEQIQDKNSKSDIIQIVKQILPTNIYIVLSGQISIWLISVFGKTTSIAQLGAISRFSALLSIFSLIFAILIIPRFTKLTVSKNQIYNQFKKIYLSLSVFILLFALFVLMFSKPILWILGAQYYGLDFALFLSLTGSCVYVSAQMIYQLLSARGIIIPFLYTISVNIIITILAVLLFDMSTLNGVLYLHILVTTSFFVMNSFYSFKILNKN